MNPLYAIFESRVLPEGDKINKIVQEKYNLIQDVLGEENLPRKDIGLFTYYPYLFEEDFKKVERDLINQVAAAGLLYFDHIFFFDKLYDNQVESDFFVLYQKNLLGQSTIALLTELFGKNHVFWRYFNFYLQQYIHAIKLDKKEHKGILKRYEPYEYQKIAQGKSAVAKCSVAALACLAGEEWKIDLLEKTQDYYAEATQLFDDLRDWKDDLHHRNYSKLLTEIMMDHDIPEGTTDEVVLEALFKYGYDEKVLSEVNKLCEQSMITAGESEAWIRNVRILQMRANKLYRELHQMAGRTEKKIEVISVDDGSIASAQKIADSAMEFVIRQQKKAYPELKHWMVFSHGSGFTGKEQLQGGDVFQRSFILNLLYDIKEMGHYLEESLFKEEIDYICKSRTRFYEYGWNYFPDLPELAPDIDTLSEIIKLGLNTSSFDDNSSEVIRKTIGNVLSWNTLEDGAFETWILDKNDNSPNTIKSLEAAVNLWGTDPDPEVVANFIYALICTGDSAHKAVIESGMRWLLEKQNEEGFWECTWYTGSFYGMYICSRLFKQSGYFGEASKNALEFLLKNQHENGALGDEIPNPQDTALGLCALINFGEVLSCSDIKDRVKKAVCYIASQVNEFGYWNSVDFIQMDTGRVSGETQMVYYRSAIMTSVICIYAIYKGLKFLR